MVTTMVDRAQLPAQFLNTFARHISLFRFIGVDIFPRTNVTFVRKYSRLFAFNMLYIPMLVSQVLYLALGGRVGATFLEVANAVPTTFMALQDAVKMFVVFIKRNSIKLVILEIAEIWPTQLHPHQNTVVTKWLLLLKILDNAFFLSSIVALLTYELAPLLLTLRDQLGGPGNSSYRYPLQSYCTYWLDAPWQYAIAYFYLFTTSVTTHMVLYISSDFLLVSLTFDLCALLDLLQNDLQDAVKSYDASVLQSVQDIKYVVRRHQKLLRLAERLSNIFGLLVFVQVSFSSVVICCFGFLTVIGDGMQLSNLMAMICYVVSLWNLCWAGQLLVDTSVGVADAAYNSGWYSKDIEFRKFIVIIMNKAQKPCYLTILGFSDLTLVTFSKILTTAWSYLSLLNSMYEDLDT